MRTISYKRLHSVAVAVLLAALGTGCAGASSTVIADSSHYPISMSPVVRDQSGMLLERWHLQKVGDFAAANTKMAFFYSLAIPRTYDVSQEVNRQVSAVGGEAIVNFTVSVSDGCAWLNAFPLANSLPIWPGCVPITVTGDIVRRASARPTGAP
jgi:hypothetical protein